MTAVNLLLDPTLGAELAWQKRGRGGPPDVMRQNKLDLKRTQQLNRERRREAAERPATGPQRNVPSKYREVSARFQKDETRGYSNYTRPKTADGGERPKATATAKSKPVAPWRPATAKQERPMTTNNGSGRAAAPQRVGTARPKTGTGRVPAYLKKRQQTWAKEEEERQFKETVLKDCPPGHVLLPEPERLRTLVILRRNLADFTAELSEMSISSSTLRYRQRKGDLEAQIVDTEQAISFFSRSKVFVKAAVGSK